MIHKTSRKVYAVDVGSTRKSKGGSSNFAWASVDPETPDTLNGSYDIELLAERLVVDLSAGVHVALGFEAPLFVPVPLASSDLSRGRANEGSRSFAAPAGLAVTTLCVHQAAWILRRVAEDAGPVAFKVAPDAWPPSQGETVLFCWEAFVSEAAHSALHLTDAATAAMGFVSREGDLSAASAVTAEKPLSLVAAAALWSGLTDNLQALHEPTVVVRPTEPFQGVIRPA